MGSLRYSNSLEPLRELETVRIKLVKDFIDEPMFVAKFPHPLNCILSLTPRKARAQGAVCSGPGDREEGLVPGGKALSEP